MTWTELHRTLAQLVEAVSPPADSGIRVDEASLVVPLEATMAVTEGRPVFLARVPHSRWRAGVLPEVHTGTISIVRQGES